MKSAPTFPQPPNQAAWQRAQSTLEAIDDSIITVDRQGRIEYLNPAAMTLLDLNRSATGEPLHDCLRMIDEERHTEIRLIGQAAVQPQADARLRALLIRSSGHEIPVKYSISDLHSESRALSGRVILIHDISTERRVQQQLSLKARHDPLTGLVNRQEFEDRLDRLFLALPHSKNTHALLFMDLDRFKRVNDACGHAAGDELLRQLSTLLMASIRGRDTLARLGGDEFALILEHCPLEEARQVAEKLREAVQHFRFTWEQQAFSIGISIGLVPIIPGQYEASTLMKAADAACYEAKSGGRNRVFIARNQASRPSGEQEESFHLEAIRNALETGTGLRLDAQAIQYLQPQTPKHLGVELLLRLDLQGIHIPTSNLLASAERYGLARQIDRYVVEQAIQFLRHRPDWDAPLFINLSEDTIQDSGFLNFVLAGLEQAPGLASRICFEIPETTIANRLAESTRLIKSLSDAGCRFTMDQVGTGASALYALHNLGIAFLKLDGNLLAGAHSDPFSLSVCRALCDVANALGIVTIACPIADAQIQASARALGIKAGQGYYLGKPLPSDSLAQQFN